MKTLSVAVVVVVVSCIFLPPANAIMVDSWIVQEGNWTVRGQNLRGSGVSARVVSRETFAPDRTFEVSFRTINTVASPTSCCSWYVAWVAGKYIDEYQRSVFMLDTTGAIGFVSSFGANKTVWSVQTNLSPFDWHTVRLEYSGNSAKVYVDNVQYLHVFDMTIGLLGAASVQLASWGPSESEFQVPSGPGWLGRVSPEILGVVVWGFIGYIGASAAITTVFVHRMRRRATLNSSDLFSLTRSRKPAFIMT